MVESVVFAYADSSALVKLMIDEPESAALRAAVGTHGVIAASEIAVVELVRAGRRVAGEVGALRARALIATLALVPFSKSIRDAAAEIRGVGMNSLDALHLASALDVRQAGAALPFYCYDRPLGDAAREAGLLTTSPGAA